MLGNYSGVTDNGKSSFGISYYSFLYKPEGDSENSNKDVHTSYHYIIDTLFFLDTF